jgi:alpha-beta hydrolase superfamily lysophospholipase
VTKNTAFSPWLADLLAGLAMSSGIGYLAAAYTVSRWLTKPSPGRPRQNPGHYGLCWEPVSCKTDDRFRLRGWVVSPVAPRGTVALFHGVRSSREQTLSRTAFLVKAGYRCVAFDHRAHGESAGRRTSFGYHEARDVKAVLDFIQQRWPYQPLAVLGISMGAAAVCFAAERVRRAQAIILESLYHDLGSAFTNRLDSAHYPPWVRRLSRGVVWVTERRFGVRMSQVNPAEYIGKLSPAPVLVLTGTEDAHAPPDEALRLYERCAGPRELWLVPHAGHRDVFEKGGEVYQQRVLDFLLRSLAVRLAG